MSNHLAIATVTKALAQILDEAVKAVVDSAAVDTQRPDHNATGARLHLFLYQVTPNTTMRNLDLPTRDSTGGVVNRPRAALDLHYLLTFYGDEKKFEPQRMLGGAVRSLLGEPGLSRARILAVSKDDGGDKLDGANLADAIEQVKFTPQSLSLEELSRIWSIFYQTPYALSVAYQATVVLIESDEPVQSSQPVLTRGQDDRGVGTQVGPFPVLESIHIGENDDDNVRLRQVSYPSARLGTILTLRGRNLGGGGFTARFTHQRFDNQIPASEPPLEIPGALTPGREGEVKISVPNTVANQSTWAAGIYAVRLVVSNGGRLKNSNDLPLSFAPQVENIAAGARDAAGNVPVTVDALPQVRLTQSAVLVLPDGEAAAAPRASQTDALQFVAINPATGTAVVRLRVDGVESLRFKFDGASKKLVMDTQEIPFP